MPLLKLLFPEKRALVENSMETVSFPAGTCIMRQGSVGDGCYLIDEGTVRLEINIDEVDSDGVLGFLEAGMWLGEFSLVDSEPRSANAYAHTDVRAQYLSVAKFKALCSEHPEVGLSLISNLSRDITRKLRYMNERFADQLISGTSSVAINQTVSSAVAAQKAFESWPEDRVDELLSCVAKAIYEKAEELAIDAVDETGLGVVDHKKQLNQFYSKGISDYLAGKTGSGFIQGNTHKGLKEIASPMGVIFGLVPITNTVITIIFKTLICLKSRNALIFSCHRSSLRVGNKAGEIIKDTLRKHGAPENLVQWVKDRSSRAKTAMFMAHKDVSFILATGGSSMVKAAYSSGTPAIGVGMGNTPVLICEDADVNKVAGLVISSKSFNNGIVCGSEHNLIIHASLNDAFVSALEANGAAVLNAEEAVQFNSKAISSRANSLRPELMGKTAETIAHATGIERTYSIRLLVVPSDKEDLQGPYAKEKLAPILSLFIMNNIDEGMELCKQLLSNQGVGHTAIIHTYKEEAIKRFGLEMPVSRVLVNCRGAHGSTGIEGSLKPSTTLGCGTLGGSSTTDNVSFDNLLNIKRMVLNCQM